MTSNKKVSVISVCFNALKALQVTAKSVLAQDYPGVEYIIVDGGSTDGTKEWLSKNGHNIVWQSEPDKGIYDAMNKGVQKASGDYCIFMNAGDTFVESTTISDCFSQADGSDVIYGDIYKNGTRKGSLSPRNSHKMYYCHQAVFVRTDLLKLFPFDIRYKMSADFKQAKLLFRTGHSFQHVDIPVANFDTSGVSNAVRSKGLLENMRVVCEVDSVPDCLKFIPRLLIPYLMCKIRGK